MFPYPSTAIPTLPTAGNFCLVQIHKDFKKAFLTPKLDSPYYCGREKPLETRRGILRVQIELVSAGLPCDQDPKLIPDGSILTASGIVIRRADGLADFTSYGRGRFLIKTLEGEALFNGFIELMVRIGTHHPPFGDEPCNLENHIEGWLVGLGVTKLKEVCLRAFMVATGTIDLKETTPITKGTLNGVLIKPSNE